MSRRSGKRKANWRYYATNKRVGRTWGNIFISAIGKSVKAVRGNVNIHLMNGLPKIQKRKEYFWNIGTGVCGR